MGNKTPYHKNEKQTTEVGSNKTTSKETIHSHESLIPFNHANINIDTFKIILSYLSLEEKRILCITCRQFFEFYCQLTFGILKNHKGLELYDDSLEGGFKNHLKFIKECPNFNSYIFSYISYPKRITKDKYFEPLINSIQYGSITYGDLFLLSSKEITFVNLKYLFIMDESELYGTNGPKNGLDIVKIIKSCFPNLIYLTIDIIIMLIHSRNSLHLQIAISENLSL
jgi:hypothetical protein